MSSDIYIPAAEAMSKLDMEIKQQHDGESIDIRFGSRAYYRECEVFGDKLHISCGGEFRQWIQEYLKRCGCSYEMI